jgi:cellulose synthase/poly-beta-1,6-N-acetylglucosamine synthase-like glycosyltransferase
VLPLMHPLLDLLFLGSVFIIWGMIVYQLVLTLAGYRYRQRIMQEHEGLLQVAHDLAPISIMIPARNEEVVIDKTMRTILALDYPPEKLELVIIDDGSSDRTAEIISTRAQSDPRIKLVSLPAGETGHGKAHALNEGLKHCTHDLIAIYDADNTPEPGALRHLALHLQDDPALAAVIGKFRCVNRRRTWLTRFVNIETIAFQWILQAGRFHLSRVAILPGTNYIIKKSVIEQVGGWDDRAITEDSELSMRIYQAGWQIKFMPLSVTWEQEPETLRVWIRQRTRWVRGNNYVIRKFIGPMLKTRSRFLVTEFIYLFALYYLFLAATVASLLLFIASSTGLISLNVPGPYFAVWLSAFALFTLEIFMVLSYEGEDSISNILLTVAMYFTYCQLWLYIVFKALILDARRHRVGVWDKTERFKVDEPVNEEVSA